MKGLEAKFSAILPRMSPKNPVVIVTRKLTDPVEARLTALFGASLNPSDAAFSAEALAKAVATADILVPAITDRLGPDIIAAAGPNLKLIANFGAGMDHIDLAAARARGLIVTNTPGVLTEDTADLTMALILGVPRRLPEGMARVAAHDFPGWSPTWMVGRRLGGMKLGIVGMEIHYHNRRRLESKAEAALGATYWNTIDSMLPIVDMVSLHCPRTEETYRLFSAERLARLKPGAYLINTARGDIVDEAALAQALAEGRLAGAGLDVFEREPEIHPKLLQQKNAMLLPHMGSGTIEARTAMGEKVIANIAAFLRGGAPPDRVV